MTSLILTKAARRVVINTAQGYVYDSGTETLRRFDALPALSARAEQWHTTVPALIVQAYTAWGFTPQRARGGRHKHTSPVCLTPGCGKPRRTEKRGDGTTYQRTVCNGCYQATLRAKAAAKKAAGA